jgi:hypothetical protein
MKATFSLEYIGSNNDWIIDFKLKPWACEITGRNIRGSLIRRFISPKWDYRGCNSNGSRGIFLWFIAESGKLYEVKHRTSWRGSDRYYCTVNDSGDLIRLEREVAEEWIKGLSDSTF